MSQVTIKRVHARQVLDSRGNPTVEAEVATSSGFGRATVPSGASTGSNEAVELRDAGEHFLGKGVNTAVQNVIDRIGPAIVGRDVTRQESLDLSMIDLDGTTDKSGLGSNAILAVSMAAARAAADSLRVPLYRYLGGASARVLPIPYLNVVNGGVHAANSIDIQEFMLVPAGLPTFSDALRAGAEIYQVMKSILTERGLATNVGDEGGLAPNLKTSAEAIELLIKGIESAGYEVGSEVALALDVAATELWQDDAYQIEGRGLDREQMIEYLAHLAEDYPIVSIEDGLNENDWDGWKHLTARLGADVQLVGDDLFVTNVKMLERGIEEASANAILVKVNQIGTVSETLDAIATATRAGFAQMVSHRSGETEDTFISHLAVATNSGQIKTGAPARGERTAKYNELLRIEEQLGDEARYAGWGAFRGVK